MDCPEWYIELRKAWRSYRSTEDNKEDFLSAAAKIVSDPTGGQSSVCIVPKKLWWLLAVESPTEQQAVTYYREVIDVQTHPLRELIAYAASGHSCRMGRARDFALLAACFAYFMKKRMQGFFTKLVLADLRWGKLTAKFYENINRMYDHGTWAFIQYARQALPVASTQWARLFFWVFRSSYTCTSRRFWGSIRYESLAEVETSFNINAYNHQCGRWDCLRVGLVKLIDVSEELGALTERIVVGNVGIAVRAMHQMRSLLFDTLGEWVFNINEAQWHLVLLREANLFIKGKGGDSVERFRCDCFQECLYGSGGLQGLQLFYPRASQATAEDCAQDLIGYFNMSSQIAFNEAHDLQWQCCLFVKSVNIAYCRKAPAATLRDAEYFAMWHERIVTYPGGRKLFRSIAANVGLGDQFDTFLSQCLELRRQIRAGKLRSDCSCRRCWSDLEITPTSGRWWHSDWKEIGALCQYQIAAKRAKIT